MSIRNKEDKYIEKDINKHNVSNINENLNEENEEDNTFIQTLHSYEKFQKKNINYGKQNPYKKKENKLNKIRNKLGKLLSNYNIQQFEKKQKGEEHETNKFLTSRAAMWNAVEKCNLDDYDLKLENSNKDSILVMIIDYINIFINDTLNDKKGIAYLASFMIILSVIITFISAFLAIINTSNQQKLNDNSKYINKFMDFMQNEKNENNMKYFEIMKQFENNKNMKNIEEIKQNSFNDLNIFDNKIKKIESQLNTNVKEIDYFKDTYTKEIEKLKKQLQDNYYNIQNKIQDYINNTDKKKSKQEEQRNKKNSENIYSDISNENDMKKLISFYMEMEKNELLYTINIIQEKIKLIEDKMKKKENFIKYDNQINNENVKIIDKKERSIKDLDDLNYRNLNKLQRDIDIVNDNIKKANNFVDNIFPSFEEKFKKNIEAKIKYYFDLYKKDLINEIAKTKLDNEEKYNYLETRQEKIKNELLKNINDQVNNQIQNMKQEIEKSLLNIHKNNLKTDINKSINVTGNIIDNIQTKLDEVYNELILDYDQIDWALQSLGAKIVYKMTSTPLNKNDFIEKLLNQIVPFLPSEEIYGMVKPIGKDPSILLDPNNFPGNCFAFQGNKGIVTIHLPATIHVTSIAIHHVHENINNNLNATPKYFSVYGIIDTNWPEHFESDIYDFKDLSLFNCMESIYGNITPNQIYNMWLKNKEPNKIHLGNFYFDRKKRVSIYPTKHCFPFKRIIFEFTENYGADYTCIYRLKVHGKKCIRKKIIKY